MHLSSLHLLTYALLSGAAGGLPGQTTRILPFLFLGVAIFAVLCLAGYLLVKPFHDDRSEVGEIIQEIIVEPHGDLFPAQAGLLIASENHLQWDQAFACLLELARRRIMTVEETRRGTGYDPIREYTLQLESNQASVLPFEAGLLEAFFLNGSRLDVRIPLSSAWERFRARQARFFGPLVATLVKNGLFDPERAETRRNLHRLERLAFLLTVLTTLTAIPGLAMVGWSALLPAAGFLAGGLVLRRLRQEFTIYSPAGRTAADRWRAFAAYLAEPRLVSQISSQPEVLESLLSYAAAFGLGLQWAGQIKVLEDFNAPPWFTPAMTWESREAFSRFMASAAMLDISEKHGIG